MFVICLDAPIGDGFAGLGCLGSSPFLIVEGDREGVLGLPGFAPPVVEWVADNPHSCDREGTSPRLHSASEDGSLVWRAIKQFNDLNLEVVRSVCCPCQESQPVRNISRLRRGKYLALPLNLA